MKRLSLAVMLIALFVTGSLFAKGRGDVAAGIYGNMVGSGSGAFGGGMGITVQFGHFPVLGVEWQFGDSGRLAASIDYWAINSHLGGALDYYLGLGGFVGFGTGANTALDFGARIPIGLQIYPVDRFEIFGEFAPMVGFLPSVSLNFALRLGIRVHV